MSEKEIHCFLLGHGTNLLTINSGDVVDDRMTAALVAMAMKGIVRCYTDKGITLGAIPRLRLLMVKITIRQGRLHVEEAKDRSGILFFEVDDPATADDIKHIQGILDRMMELPDYKDILLKLRLDAL